jgi:hypothetical protein
MSEQAETAVVVDEARRGIGFDSFADLTKARVTEIVEPRRGGVAWVKFADDIDEATQRAVAERMLSRDARDEARRAKLRAAASGKAVNLAEMTAAYVLDEPIPDPIPATSATTATAPKTTTR